MNHNYFKILLRLLFVLTSVGFSLVIAYLAFKYAFPFIIALIIAYLINPIVNNIQEKTRLPRWFCVATVLIIFIGLTIGSITILISEMIMGTNYLSQSVPVHFQSLVYELKEIFTDKVLPIYEQISALFYSLESDHQATILTYIETVTVQITSSASTAIQVILNSVSEFLLRLPNLATVIIISILATFFISKDWYRFIILGRRWSPKSFIERTKYILQNLKKAFVGFFFAQLTLISITCCIVLIGLLILGIEYPITIALIIAIVDLIPYLGTGLIFLPWIFYTFFSEQLSLTIGLSILYGIVIVQRQIMEPKILSSNIGVDPLAILISLFVGYKVFGFSGLIIGPVILVFIQTLFKADVFKDLKNYIIGN